MDLHSNDHLDPLNQLRVALAPNGPHAKTLVALVRELEEARAEIARLQEPKAPTTRRRAVATRKK